MKRSYKIISYLLYTSSLMYISKTMYNTGLDKFDLPYYVNNIYYLFMLGIFGSFIFFRFGNYDKYIKKHASYLLIRYGDFDKIYRTFVCSGILQSLGLTLIRVVTDVIIFGTINGIDILIYFMVMASLILMHINFEIIINSKCAIIMILGYFATSFSFCDLLMENNMNSLTYCFIPNMLFSARRGSLAISIAVLILVIISNFIIGRLLIEKKEIL
ncbi:MAG: hypothetical protein RR623_09935 [Bacilli bacterium]